MARVGESVVVDLPVEVAFAVSQTHGEVRYRWHSFVRSQHLVDAERPARGVPTVTRSRHGLRMVSDYTAFKPPGQVGIPHLRRRLELPDARRRTDRSHLALQVQCPPAWLSPIAERIGLRLLPR